MESLPWAPFEDTAAVVGVHVGAAENNMAELSLGLFPAPVISTEASLITLSLSTVDASLWAAPVNSSAFALAPNIFFFIKVPAGPYKKADCNESVLKEVELVIFR